MKHLKKITLLVTLLTFSSLCFSHGSTTTRSKCRWYAKKYRAYARVNNGPGIKIQTQSGCGGTYTAYVSYPCVWQQSINSWGASYFSGAVTATTWLCGRGFEKSELMYELIEPATMDEENQGEAADISNDPIIFKRRQIIIPNLSGYMMAEGENVFSSLEITAWIPQDDSTGGGGEDTIITPDKTIWYGKITLKNNEAILEGEFPDNVFELIGAQGAPSRVEFLAGSSIQIPLPANLDGTKDMIALSITSDGGQSEGGDNRIANQELKTENDAAINLELFPNPTSDEVRIKFTPEVEGKGTVRVYDVTGKFVSEVFNGIFKENENVIDLKLSELNIEKGTLFIFIETNGKKYLKRVIYSN